MLLGGDKCATGDKAFEAPFFGNGGFLAVAFTLGHVLPVTVWNNLWRSQTLRGRITGLATERLYGQALFVVVNQVINILIEENTLIGQKQSAIAVGFDGGCGV